MSPCSAGQRVGSRIRATSGNALQGHLRESISSLRPVPFPAITGTGADKFLYRLPGMIPKAAPDQTSHRHDRIFFKKSGTLKTAAIWKAVTRQERVAFKQAKGRDPCTS